jgi:tRNA-splicing ligase RtcB
MAGKDGFDGPLLEDGPARYRIPKSYRDSMRVDGLIFSAPEQLAKLRSDRAPEQVVNVATLPGIVRASIAMPDIHWGYGFCIGGVAATLVDGDGVVSPGGVGYDINCGVRLVRTNLTHDEVRRRFDTLMRRLYEKVPAGTGTDGRFIFEKRELTKLMESGAAELVKRGLGAPEDVERAEAGAMLAGANPDFLTERAFERGRKQCGTLGSGNHFAEIQVVDRVYDEAAAEAFGLFPGQVCAMIHSGSRGLGYQVCDDTLRDFRDVPRKYGITLPDPQLACAPIHSPEGQRYLASMRAAANFAWCNRQLLMVEIREAFESHFDMTWEALGMEIVYDVAHNIAKFEEHDLGDGTRGLVCVHRKGATRSYPAGHPEVPERYRAVGQPVLIPGDMGTASWVLAGEPGSMALTFGTTCHGAGRQMSRTAAVKAAKGRNIQKELEKAGVIAMARSRAGLEEEQPDAYKDVDEVVGAVHAANLSRKVARMKPIGVIKG